MIFPMNEGMREEWNHNERNPNIFVKTARHLRDISATSKGIEERKRGRGDAKRFWEAIRFFRFQNLVVVTLFQNRPYEFSTTKKTKI